MTVATSTGGGALGRDSPTPRRGDPHAPPKKPSLPVVTAVTRAEVVPVWCRRERKTPLSAFKGMSLTWAVFFFSWPYGRVFRVIFSGFAPWSSRRWLQTGGR
jgi:hypothetical protein